MKIDATLRDDVGKGASRRLRRLGRVPAVVYGADQSAQSLVIEHKQLWKSLENEEFYSQIIALDVGGKETQVVLKDLQRHVFKPQVLHVDFLRIKATEKLVMRIPLHYKGETLAPGVKDGGVLSRILSDIEIKCLPKDLPKFIEVDVSELKLNANMHLSDLKLPAGVEIAGLVVDSLNDRPVVTIHMVKEEVAAKVVTAEAVEAAVAAPAAPGAAPVSGKEGKEGKEVKEGKEGKEGKKEGKDAGKK